MSRRVIVVGEAMQGPKGYCRRTMAAMVPSSPEVSERMAGVRNRDTAAELGLRRELHRRGLRYRVNLRIPEARNTAPDIVFTRCQVAVFVDGCFWHQCPEHATTPRANAQWWAAKLANNRQRDDQIDDALTNGGWMVVRIWEHESIGSAADRVERAVRSRFVER